MWQGRSLWAWPARCLPYALPLVGGVKAALSLGVALP